MMYIAHRAQDGREQSLKNHLLGTAALAASFAEPFGAGELARQLGLSHDVGKYQESFQRRIRGENIRVDHSTAGAKEICNFFGWPAAYCVAGHHGGLPDGGGRLDSASGATLSGRLKRDMQPYADYAKEVSLSRANFQRPTLLCRRGFSFSFWIRMLFSCLVDADFLDTETFMRGSPAPRGSDITMDALLSKLNRYVSAWWDARTPLNRTRCDVLRACMQSGKAQSPGLFTLTVPTGGGKTVSSLAFALCHAVAHDKRRVIYVIPYTSIIEQTADTFRAILGEEAVLEHHANVDLDDSEDSLPDPLKERRKLSAENWDVPVVVTTAVQFFESLFSNRPSRCRKLHNLVNSVIVFDEAQTLPLPYLLPCVRAIAELTVNYGASCVLCTATQPALGDMFTQISPTLSPREIAPPIPETVFRRVRYAHLGTLSDEALAQRLNAHKQALCIVSTRKQAQRVYSQLDREGSFHLSTLMAPEHRRAILKTVRARLEDGLPCRVVSTSLIEAGVDVDFPVVYRAEAGLDSIIQAAGRCNREGKRSAEDSVVYVFKPDDVYAATLPHAMRRPIEVMHFAAREGEPLDSPQNIERYFTELFRFSGPEIDRHDVVKKFEDGVQDPSRPSFPFDEIAQKFRLIEQSTRTVLVPRPGEAEEIARRLCDGEQSRGLMRRAERFAVNVYESHFDALNARGALCVLNPDFAVLTDLSLYSEDTGLTLMSDGGQGIFL